MISRQNLVTGALGLVAGIVGAVIATEFVVRPAGLAPSPSSPSVPARVVVPPGWDPRIAEQVAALERRVGAAEDALGSRGAPGPAAGPAASDEDRDDGKARTSREVKRLEHYQEELASYAESAARHETEPIDAGWSEPLSRSVESELSLGGKERSFEVKGVDCRSKTCLATLTFGTPAEALRFVAKGDPRLTVDGCKGFTIVPPPPGGDGPYDLPIMYSCR